MNRMTACEEGRHWPRCPGTRSDIGVWIPEDKRCDCVCHTTDAEDAEIDRLELEIMYGRKPRP